MDKKDRTNKLEKELEMGTEIGETKKEEAMMIGKGENRDNI